MGRQTPSPDRPTRSNHVHLTRISCPRAPCRSGRTWTFSTKLHRPKSRPDERPSSRVAAAVVCHDCDRPCVHCHGGCLGSLPMFVRLSPIVRVCETIASLYIPGRLIIWRAIDMHVILPPHQFTQPRSLEAFRFSLWNAHDARAHLLRLQPHHEGPATTTPSPSPSASPPTRSVVGVHTHPLQPRCSQATEHRAATDPGEESSHFALRKGIAREHSSWMMTLCAGWRSEPSAEEARLVH